MLGKPWRCTSLSIISYYAFSSLLAGSSVRIGLTLSHLFPCFFCFVLAGYTVSCLCSLLVHKKTNWIKKGDASQAVIWMNYPPFSFLGIGPDKWETAEIDKQWQGRRAGQKSWLDWIRCNMKLETIQPRVYAQRPRSAMWECEVTQEANAVINLGRPHQ